MLGLPPEDTFTRSKTEEPFMKVTVTPVLGVLICLPQRGHLPVASGVPWLSVLGMDSK